MVSTFSFIYSAEQEILSWKFASTNMFFHCWPQDSVTGSTGIILIPSPQNWLHLSVKHNWAAAYRSSSSIVVFRVAQHLGFSLKLGFLSRPKLTLCAILSCGNIIKHVNCLALGFCLIMEQAFGKYYSNFNLKILDVKYVLLSHFG